MALAQRFVSFVKPTTSLAGFVYRIRLVSHLFCAPENCVQAAIYIAPGSPPRRHADPHCGFSLPRHQYLVEHRLVGNVVSSKLQAVREPPRMGAGSLQKIGHSRAAQRFQSGPRCQPHGSARIVVVSIILVNGLEEYLYCA